MQIEVQGTGYKFTENNDLILLLITMKMANSFSDKYFDLKFLVT